MSKFEINRRDNYKDSIIYKFIQKRIEEKNLREMLPMVKNMCQNENLQKYASMLDILVEAYEKGDNSDKLIEQFKKTVDEVFEVLQKNGLLHHGTFKIESIRLPQEENNEDNEDSDNFPPISTN